MEENKTLSELKNTKGMVVGHDRIERFQAAFRGEVIRPGDSGYETARKIWNASIDKHPGIIARCSGVADVVAAVNFARENELLVAVRGDGKARVASANENEDLFWALRGGGGNFGVVTSFEFSAHPVSTVLGGMVMYSRDHAVEVLRFYRDFTQSAPEELTAYAALLHTPDGIPAVAVIGCYCGDVTEGEKVFRPLRTFGSPMLDAIQPMAFPQMQTFLDAGSPHGNHNYWKSTFLREFSDDAIVVLVEHANRATSPLSGVVIEYYGGVASRVGVSETAFAQRQAQYDVLILAQWVDPGESQRHIEWARGLADSMRPFSSSAYFLNYLGEEGEDTIKAAFGPNYDRLMAVKKKYDPKNFFSLNQNIKPEV